MWTKHDPTNLSHITDPALRHEVEVRAAERARLAPAWDKIRADAAEHRKRVEAHAAAAQRELVVEQQRLRALARRDAVEGDLAVLARQLADSRHLLATAQASGPFDETRQLDQYQRRHRVIREETAKVAMLEKSVAAATARLAAADAELKSLFPAKQPETKETP